MISRDELGAYVYDFLHCANIDDYAPNGLQVEGRNQIERICTAVTASKEAIHAAAMMKADALLVHHGYFWKGESQVITGSKYQRIKALMDCDMSLFAYHLPLDCHLELGNNACLGARMGIVDCVSHKTGKVANLLWSGQLQQPLTLDAFSQQLMHVLDREPLCIKAHDQLIHRVAWCSGGAQDLIEEANRLQVDAYLSGEISERTYYQAKELGINYLSCGHHATERYGIQALGEHLALTFSLQHHFIDSDNPV